MDNKYLKLLKSIRELQRFLDKLAKFISSQKKHNILEDKSKAKEIFLNKYDEFDDLSQNIEMLLIQSGLENDEIDLEEFLSGMFKKPKKPKKNKPNRYKKPNRREEAGFEFEQFMESLTGRPNSRKNFRQSPKFRQLNQSFNYEKDWALKPTEGYGNDFILSLDDNLVKYHFPNFDRKNEIKIHLANSAGMLINKDFHFHMVRVGLSMYGYSPLDKIDKNLSLKPALFLKAKVAFIRTIDPGVGVSYGGKFVSHRKTNLAVLSIGYADGVPRNLSGKINVIHNDKLYPQVGSITMDQMMVDITGSSEIKVGSTMVLLGSDGDKTISPLEWARKSNTIPWEILCSFKNRLPRVQVD